MYSSRPISGFVFPRAASASISISRPDSGCGGGWRSLVTRRPATDGASTVSPRAAARTASASSAALASFSRYPAAPASTARRMSASVSYVVSTTTFASGSSLMAATPSPPGIRKSIRITSNSRALARATASGPDPASPVTSISGSAASMPRSPDRTTGWSSASMTRMRVPADSLASSLMLAPRRGRRFPRPARTGR